MSDEQFEEIVNQAIENLPKDYISALDNVAITVEDWPNNDQLRKGRVTHGTLYGLYEGVPRTQRGNNYSLVIPDKITIFKGPLTRSAVNEDHLKRLVTNTVWHEIAHHFGLDHDRINYLEKKSQTKQQFSEPVEYVESKLLSKAGVRHAWFTRQGGVSQIPFYSLNVATGVGDHPEYVEENIRRATAELNLDRNRLVHLQRLAHDKKVLVAGADHGGGIYDDYDAIITNVKDLPIALNTADCLTIFLFDPIVQAIAIVHAGWKGTIRQVVKSAVEQMAKNYNSKPKDIISALGPAIRVDSYEIDNQVAQNFEDKYLKHVDGKIYLDFVQANVDQLKEVGVMQIEDCGIDTFTDKNFFSYRRDNVTGRHLGVISL